MSGGKSGLSSLRQQRFISPKAPEPILAPRVNSLAKVAKDNAFSLSFFIIERPMRPIVSWKSGASMSSSASESSWRNFSEFVRLWGLRPF